MNFKNIFFVGFFLVIGIIAKGQNEISIARFGAVPNNTINDRNAIQHAIDYCKIHKIKKLIFDIMNGRFGKNSQDSIYRPYYPYTKGLNFSGIQNLRVEAKINHG